MSVFGIGGIGGFFLDGAAKGQFADGGAGLVPDAVAYQKGAEGGNMLVGLFGGTPLASLPSPANMDPAVSIFGMDKGPVDIIGGFVEDNSDLGKYVGGIAGGIIGAMYGEPELGWRAGWTAGVMGGATVDTTSDAGIGIFDLDGEETRDQQAPIVNWWRA